MKKKLDAAKSGILATRFRHEALLAALGSGLQALLPFAIR
jgi:hypothetical protein